MVNIVICGANGKMGKNVYNCISERDDCKVVGGIDVYTKEYADFPIVDTPSKLPIKPDVIIDYSNPASLDGLLEYCLSTGTPAVLATTGYNDEQISRIKAAASQIPVFFTFNMSLGINLLVQLAKKAAEILGDQFDIEIVEKHHNQKIDAPSGTAIMLANANFLPVTCDPFPPLQTVRSYTQRPKPYRTSRNPACCLRPRCCDRGRDAGNRQSRYPQAP